MHRVTSRHNPRLAEAVGLLSSSRDRRKSGRCVLEGVHLIEVYLDRIGVPETLIVAEESFDEPPFRALAARVPEDAVITVPAAIFGEISTQPAAVGALAVIVTPTPALPKPAGFHLLLEDVQDPGNVGAMLRTAAAAGVEQVLLSKHCAFAWSPKVLRAGQGAHFLTAIVEDVDLVAWARAFRPGGRVVATVARRWRRPLRDGTPGTGRHRDRQRGRGPVRAVAGRSRCPDHHSHAGGCGVAQCRGGRGRRAVRVRAPAAGRAPGINCGPPEKRTHRPRDSRPASYDARERASSIALQCPCPSA